MPGLTNRRKIGVIGLGYVGLPVATGFAAAGFEVAGYDIDEQRIIALSKGYDATRETPSEALKHPKLRFTANIEDLREQDFFIVTVPTPIDEAQRPDLSHLYDASSAIGKILKQGDIVVYEATVYPGATEEECVPLLEQHSGLKVGSDFSVGYSPERINPGDNTHGFTGITKVVAGLDEATLDVVADTYGAVVIAGVYRASSIKVAEAAKAIENTQRDLNIALVNELSLLFARMDLDTNDVLAAAATKWNFHPFSPGLVGGHCIGVDPYYLTHKAQSMGFHPQVILAGRQVNDSMGQHIGRECARLMMKANVSNPVVTVLGLTYKENIPDIRNTKVVDIVHELQSFGMSVQIADQEADKVQTKNAYGFDLQDVDSLAPADAVIFAVPHKTYVAGGWPLMQKLLRGGKGTVLDVKGRLDRTKMPANIALWRL